MNSVGKRMNMITVNHVDVFWLAEHFESVEFIHHAFIFVAFGALSFVVGAFGKDVVQRQQSIPTSPRVSCQLVSQESL